MAGGPDSVPTCRADLASSPGSPIPPWKGKRGGIFPAVEKPIGRGFPPFARSEAEGERRAAGLGLEGRGGRTGGEIPGKTSEGTFPGPLSPKGGSAPLGARCRSLKPPRGIGAPDEVNSPSRRLFFRGRLRRGKGRAARAKPRACPRVPPSRGGLCPAKRREGRGPLPSRKGKIRLFPRGTWFRSGFPRRKSEKNVEDLNAEVRAPVLTPEAA
jgi:hypothetical protein